MPTRLGTVGGLWTVAEKGFTGGWEWISEQRRKMGTGIGEMESHFASSFMSFGGERKDRTI